MQISGASVLLTGATGGIGQAIARALHDAGAGLLLTGRRSEILDPLAGELGARAVTVDLSDRGALEQLVADAGEVDILVANAALPGTGSLDDFSQEQIDRAIEVNLRAPIALARALAPPMVARRRGQLVFISSLAGKAASPHASLYNATKFGLRGFSQALRQELHGTCVGVSTVFPGFIRDAGMFAESGTQLPAGVGTRTPDDVARAVVRAIEQDRGEVDVAPLALRAGTVIGSMAPGLAAAITRRVGGDDIPRQLAKGQADKR